MLNGWPHTHVYMGMTNWTRQIVKRSKEDKKLEGRYSWRRWGCWNIVDMIIDMYAILKNREKSVQSIIVSSLEA